jgi:hypothetical protein
MYPYVRQQFLTMWEKAVEPTGLDRLTHWDHCLQPVIAGLPTGLGNA